MDWTISMEGGGSLYLRDDGNYFYLEAKRYNDNKGLYKVVIEGLSGRQVLGSMIPSGDELKLSRMISHYSLGQWGCLPIRRALCQLSFPFQPESTPTVEKVADAVALEVQSPPEEEENATSSDFVPAEEAPLPLTQPEPPVEEEGNPDEEELWNPVPDVAESPQQALGFLPCQQLERWLQEPLLLQCFSRFPQVFIQEKGEDVVLAVPYALDTEFHLSPLFCFAEFCTMGEESYLKFSFSKEGRPLAK